MQIFTDDQVTQEQIRKPMMTYSVWQAYLSCPAAFYFGYIMKIERGRSWQLAFGSSWDIALNVFAQNKLEGKDHGAEAVIDVFDKTFRTEFGGVQWEEDDLFTKAQKKKVIEKSGEISVEEMQRARRETEDFWRTWGTSRLREYVKQIGPTVKPKYTQKKFFIDFGPEFEFGFKGTIDRIDEDGTVVDNKTSKGRWSNDDVEFDLQCVGYSLAYRILERKPERQIRFDVMVKTKTQEFSEQFQQLEMTIQPHKFNLFLSEMTNVYRNIKNGVIYRNLNKFNSPCGWCEYRDMCWNPHQVWSRQPSEEEVKAWLLESPENKEKLQAWIANETAQDRLVDWGEVGRDLKQIASAKPEDVFKFWY